MTIMVTIRPAPRTRVLTVRACLDEALEAVTAVRMGLVSILVVFVIVPIEVGVIVGQARPESFTRGPSLLIDAAQDSNGPNGHETSFLCTLLGTRHTHPSRDSSTISWFTLVLLLMLFFHV